MKPRRHRAGGRTPGRSRPGSRRSGPIPARASNDVVAAMPGSVGRGGVLDVDPDPGEQVVDLADAVHRRAGVLKLLQVRAAGRAHASSRAGLRAGGTPQGRPRTAARSRARPRARPSSPRAPPSTPRTARARAARRRGTRSGAPSRPTCTESPRRSPGGARPNASITSVPAIRPVAAEPQTGGVLERAHDIRRETVRIRRQRLRRHDAHQLPVPGRRLLARPERAKAPVDRRADHRGDAQDRHDRAQPQPLQRREPKPADLLGQVRERVRAGVAVRAASGSSPTPHASITTTVARRISLPRNLE